MASDLTGWRSEGVRIRVLGRREGLPPDIAAIVAEGRGADTAHNDRFLLQVAFNYGGQADIVDAARRHAERVLAGEAPDATIRRGGLRGLLSTAGAPPLDLIVRTSGERAAVQLPAVGGGLRRTGFPGRPVARLRPEALKAAIDEYGRASAALADVAADDGLRRRLKAFDWVGETSDLRAASALVLAPAAMLAIWGGGWWFAALIAAACILLAREWALMSARGAQRLVWGAVAAALVAVVLIAHVGHVPAALITLVFGAAAGGGRSPGGWASRGWMPPTGFCTWAGPRSCSSG